MFIVVHVKIFFPTDFSSVAHYKMKAVLDLLQSIKSSSYKFALLKSSSKKFAYNSTLLWFINLNVFLNLTWRYQFLLSLRRFLDWKKNNPMQSVIHLSCNSLKNNNSSFMYLPHLHRVICSGQIGRPSVKDAAFLSVRLWGTRNFCHNLTFSWSWQTCITCCQSSIAWRIPLPSQRERTLLLCCSNDNLQFTKKKHEIRGITMTKATVLRENSFQAKWTCWFHLNRFTRYTTGNAVVML